ncbi:unnamed protein product, partial [Medioppia subpectinata]
WTLFPTLLVNKRKLFSYLSFREYTAINVKIDYNKRDYLTNNIRDQIHPNWTLYPIVSPNNVNKVVIITEARSGSTFLGDLLQQSWATFYNFEPLITMRARNPRTDTSMAEEAATLLAAILDCNFTNIGDSYLQPVFWKVPYFNWNSVMKQYVQTNNIQLFNATVNEFVCQRCHNRLIKTIRFGVQDFLVLQQK